MRKKILSIFLIGVFIVCITGCGNKKESMSNDTPNKILGTWQLNTNVKSSDNDYSSLKSLFGTCLNSSDNSLTLNDDYTFKLHIGCYYSLSGKYKFEDNIISVYDINDSNSANEEDIEKNLRIELINYKNKDLFKMYLYDFEDADVYIFFEKTDGNTYGKSEVPDIEFEETNNDKNSIVVGNYTLSLGKYEIYDDGKLDRILELKENNVFELTNVNNQSKVTGTYESCKVEGYNGIMHDALRLYHDGEHYETFDVIENNVLSYQKGIIEYVD